MSLSRDRLKDLTNGSPDPSSWGTDSLTPTRSYNENSGLSDDELESRIVARNALGKPTYKLRLEYERRLRERGL